MQDAAMAREEARPEHENPEDPEEFEKTQNTRLLRLWDYNGVWHGDGVSVVYTLGCVVYVPLQNIRSLKAQRGAPENLHWPEFTGYTVEVEWRLVDPTPTVWCLSDQDWDRLRRAHSVALTLPDCTNLCEVHLHDWYWYLPRAVGAHRILYFTVNGEIRFWDWTNDAFFPHGLVDPEEGPWITDPDAVLHHVELHWQDPDDRNRDSVWYLEQRDLNQLCEALGQ